MNYLAFVLAFLPFFHAISCARNAFWIARNFFPWSKLTSKKGPQISAQKPQQNRIIFPIFKTRVGTNLWPIIKENKFLDKSDPYELTVNATECHLTWPQPITPWCLCNDFNTSKSKRKGIFRRQLCTSDGIYDNIATGLTITTFFHWSCAIIQMNMPVFKLIWINSTRRYGWFDVEFTISWITVFISRNIPLKFSILLWNYNLQMKIAWVKVKFNMLESYMNRWG